MSSANKTMFYADVVLPLALPRVYTYHFLESNSQALKSGMRVLVQLGKRKLYTGIIISISTQKPNHPTKAIGEILDEKPSITDIQLRFWHWLAQYYMCSLGEVMNAALPAGLKLHSETQISLAQPDYDWNELNNHEQILLETLENREQLSIQEAGKILELENPLRIVNRLLELQLVNLAEEVKNAAKPTVTNALKLTDFTEEELNDTFEKLKRSPKQADIILAYLKLKDAYEDGLVPEKTVIKNAQASKASLKGLLAKNIFQNHKLLVEPTLRSETPELHLSQKQSDALSQIESFFARKKPTLLHGVTSSGKTEIYITLIKKALEKHKRALYLVPEIALTTQLINRLNHHFGEQALVYHSRLSQGQRLAAYQRLISDKRPLVLLGARSAMLLPLPDLGIVVIDEEHDASFKQQDPAPRYNSRDAAIVLAQLNACPILLGSATPSAESYYNALEGKYGLVELSERYGGVHMPKMEVVDIRKETIWKTMRGHYSSRLVEEIKETLAQGKRAILFQNRRGYTPVIQCKSCGHTQECVNCDISLTYHKYSNRLKCHYCGYHVAPPNACPECGSHELNEVGFGTEKLEEELAILLPDVRIERLDLDKTRRKNAFNRIISKFENGQIDVLIGTQMVTKGLDFEDVTLVGVLSADSMLHYPDFRAQERAFQLMEQVAGRAGRRNEQGRVAIQSFKPDHRIIENVLAHDYKGMIQSQLDERKVFKYPPFVRLIKIELRHKDKQVLDSAASSFANSLYQHLGNNVLGPEYPPVGRVKNVFRKTILLKIERDLSPQKIKEHILVVQARLYQEKAFKSVRCVFDVDPY